MVEMTENKKRSRKDDVIEYYDECQQQYDYIWGTKRTMAIHYGYYDKDHKTRDEELANMNYVVARTGKITPNDKVLDIGCGVGGTAIAIAKRYGVSVVGLNINEMQVERARKDARDNNLDDFVEFVVGDMTNMEFPDESFDVVMGIESTVHVDNKKKMLSEIYRVLKKDGRFIDATFFLTKNMYRIHEKKQLDRMINGWIMTLVREDEYKTLLENAGFHSVNCENVSRNVIYSARNLFVSTVLNLGFAEFARLIGIIFNVEHKVPMENIYAALYQYPTLRKKLWKYSIVYAEK